MLLTLNFDLMVATGKGVVGSGGKEATRGDGQQQVATRCDSVSNIPKGVDARYYMKKIGT